MGQAALVAAAEPPLLRVDGFVKRYGKRSAVAGLALEVQRGEIYGLIGPDGAGKSSLMKAIAGVLSFDAGTVEVFGTNLDSEAAAELVKDRLGFMPQGLGLNLYADSRSRKTSIFSPGCGWFRPPRWPSARSACSQSPASPRSAAGR